jgi:hypothetical protein
LHWYTAEQFSFQSFGWLAHLLRQSSNGCLAGFLGHTSANDVVVVSPLPPQYADFTTRFQVLYLVKNRAAARVHALCQCLKAWPSYAVLVGKPSEYQQ